MEITDAERKDVLRTVYLNELRKSLTVKPFSTFRFSEAFRLVRL